MLEKYNYIVIGNIKVKVSQELIKNKEVNFRHFYILYINRLFRQNYKIGYNVQNFQ